MFSGEQIYNALARSKAPAERLEKLGAMELVLLADEVEGLPCSGVPVLIGALVDTEVARRFRKLNEK